MKFTGEKAELLKEIHDYFRDKIVDGEYEVIKKEEHTWRVLIDGYTFVLWIANEDFGFATYIFGDNFMALNFTVKQREKGWRKINKLIKEYNSTSLLSEKREQLNKLTKELEELEN